MAVEVPLCNQRKRPATRCPVSSTCRQRPCAARRRSAPRQASGSARLRDGRLDSPRGKLVEYSRCCGYGVRYRSSSGPRHGFQAWFPTMPMQALPFEGLRWPKGIVCPACGATQAWRASSDLWMCTECSRRTSAGSRRALSRTRRGCPSRRGLPLFGTSPTRSLGSVRWV